MASPNLTFCLSLLSSYIPDCLFLCPCLAFLAKLSNFACSLDLILPQGPIICATSLQLCPTLVTPWNVACQAPLSMGFSRQEFWCGFVAISSSRGSSQPRDQTHISYVSCIGRWVLYCSCHLGTYYWSFLISAGDTV